MLNKRHMLFVLLLGSLAFLLFLSFYFRRPHTTFSYIQSIAFYVAIFTAATAVTESILLASKIRHGAKNNIRLLYISLFVAVTLAEITLRALHLNQTYPEARNNKYYSPFNEAGKDMQRRPGIDRQYQLSSQEFSYPRTGNNYGYSDFDFCPKKGTDSLLIQTYGDSFTEGDGAPFDSSYPAQLRKLLPANVVLQNFGVCGNDPGFYLYQLKNCGLKFKPDIAVMCYGSGDYLVDFFTRGGMDRFKGDYWKARNGNPWEWIYAASYVSRPFFHSLFNTDYGKFLFSQTEYYAQLKKIEPEWNELFRITIDEARKNHIKVLLLKKPERSELCLNKYDYDFTFFESMVDTMEGVTRFDILPYYRDSLHLTLENSINYYWPKDGHHNSTGYGIMAKAVRQSFNSITF